MSVLVPTSAAPIFNMLPQEAVVFLHSWQEFIEILEKISKGEFIYRCSNCHEFEDHESGDQGSYFSCRKKTEKKFNIDFALARPSDLHVFPSTILTFNHPTMEKAHFDLGKDKKETAKLIINWLDVFEKTVRQKASEYNPLARMCLITVDLNILSHKDRDILFELIKRYSMHCTTHEFEFSAMKESISNN